MSIHNLYINFTCTKWFSFKTAPLHLGFLIEVKVSELYNRLVPAIPAFTSSLRPSLPQQLGVNCKPAKPTLYKHIRDAALSPVSPCSPHDSKSACMSHDRL